MTRLTAAFVSAAVVLSAALIFSRPAPPAADPPDPPDGVPGYQASPQLRGLAVASLGGTVHAEHAQLVGAEVLGRSDGGPGQQYEVRRPPVGTEPTRSLRPDASGRAPYRDLELANDLQAELITRGAAGDVYQGSTGSRVRVEIETRSEGAVFKALLAAAHGLLMVRERFPGKVEALELRCVVPEDGSLAGRFTLSPVVAADLTAGRIDLTRFYVENVEF